MNATDERIARFLDAFARTFPAERPPSQDMLRDVFASVDAAPPMTDRQRRRVGHLLFGGSIDEFDAT